MLAQRGAPVVAAAAPVKPRPAGMAATSGTPARKLSFKDKHALETLPAKMDSLHKTVRDLQTTLADPDLYVRNASAFQRASDALKKAESELAKTEERWLELELLRETVER